MKEEIFLQKNYYDLDPEIAVYGCNFLSLGYVTQFRNKRPAKTLETFQDVINYKNYCKKMGWLGDQCFVLKATAILGDLSPAKWAQATAKDFGFKGVDAYIPIAYPVKLPRDVNVQGGLVEIGTYRAVEDSSNTHFVVVETSSGRDFSVRELFNTLGSYWTSDQRGRFFPCDKRVYYWIG